MRTRTVLATTLAAALAGCASCDTVPSTAVTDCDAQIVPGGAAVDLLFVVDDSGSMDNNQVKLAAELGTFIDRLLGSPVALDLRIGVTNTSVDNGIAVTRYTGATFPGPAGTPYPAGALVAIAQDPDGVATGHFMWGLAYDPANLVSAWGGPRILSSATQSKAALARDFKANVAHGSWGSGKEQHLRAMKLALDKAALGGVNFGFLRSGARLAVVILTDEDDCSDSEAPYVGSGNCALLASDPDLDSVSRYAADLDYLGTTTGGALPIVGVIAEYDTNGNPSVCESGGAGMPVPPRRLDAFLNLLEPGPTRTRTVKAPVCGSFGPALLKVAETIVPQTMPLQQAPADFHMMTVKVRKATGESVVCHMAPAGPGSSDPTIDVVYHPAPVGGLPSLSFQNDCALGLSDQIELGIICAR